MGSRPKALPPSRVRCPFTGDYSVKAVGVIPEPEVKSYEISEKDKFLIMASDGVWEFITSQVRGGEGRDQAIRRV